MNTEILPQKRCKECGETKSIEFFMRDQAKKDGRALRCKNCFPARATATCADCGAQWQMLKSGMKKWHGRCRSCAQKVATNDPERKARISILAKAQIARQGGIPNTGSNPRRGAANNKWKGGLPNCVYCGKQLSRRSCRACEACNRKVLSEKMRTQRAKFKHLIRGEKHPCWRGGKAARTKRAGNIAARRNWRRAVFERDGYKCVHCGIENVQFHADHVLPIFTHPELEFDVDNGRTLCVGCHVQTPTYGWRGFYLARAAEAGLVLDISDDEAGSCNPLTSTP